MASRESLYLAGLPGREEAVEHTARVVAITVGHEDLAALQAYDGSDFPPAASDLLGHTRLEKRARTHAFASTTPEEFVPEFGRFVNDPEGYVALENARERHTAARIAKLARKHRFLLAVVEYERAAGVQSLSAGNAP